MAKSSTGGALALVGLGVVLFATAGHVDDIKNAVAKLKFSVKSIKLVPQSGVTGIGSTWLGDLWRNIKKYGKEALTVATTGQLRLQVNMQLSNPTDTDLIAKDFRFKGDVIHQGKALAKIDLKMPVKVSAHDASNIKIPMKLQLGNALTTLADSLKGGGLQSAADVEIVGNGYAMGTDFPVKQKFNIISNV